MDNMTVSLLNWVTEWWCQKQHLLVVALHREGVDYIHGRRQAGQAVTGTRTCILGMVQLWDPSGLRPVSDFTPEFVEQCEPMYSTDRRLIEGLFEQLPHNDIQWQDGCTLALSKEHGSNAWGIRSISHKSFETIQILQQYTFLVIRELEPLRMATQIAQLQVGQNHTLQELATARVRSHMATMPAKRPSSGVALNTFAPSPDPYGALPQGWMNPGPSAVNYVNPSSTYNPQMGLGNGILGFAGANAIGLSPVYDPHGGLGNGLVGFGSCCSMATAPFEDVDDSEEGGYSLIPVNSIEGGAYAQKVIIEPLKRIYDALGLNVEKLRDTYPESLVMQVWTMFPPSKRPTPPVSVVSLLFLINKIPEASIKDQMRSEVCRIVQNVTGMIGGTQTVTLQDLGGCQRQFSKAAHLGRGSHDMFSCPHARYGGTDLDPRFNEIYDMVTPERLMAQCHLHQANGHVSATCAAQRQNYNSCPNCRAYMLHVVYPVRFQILVQIMRDSHTSDVLKHVCRVQLAAGLLSAAWALRPHEN